MHKTIISDTSCFIILSKIGELDLLKKIYGQIVTTSDIVEEFGETLPDWVIIENVSDKSRQRILELQIDRGESSAIALALEIPKSTLILDDFKARKIAEQLGISFTGTIGVIIKAKLNGIIPSIKPYLEKIKETNFRISAEIELQALKEAKLGVWPNPLLLKARLLTDGGYTKEALALLQGKQQVFTSPLDKLEYVYRIGRIYEDLGKDLEAVAYFKQTIQLGANQTAYFAARAALQAGQILEKRGQKKEAISFYEQCLAMEEHSYKNSLDQRAKAGIARCK
jgi:predicted nucleic acid-binding protein